MLTLSRKGRFDPDWRSSSWSPDTGPRTTAPVPCADDVVGVARLSSAATIAIVPGQLDRLREDDRCCGSLGERRKTMSRKFRSTPSDHGRTLPILPHGRAASPRVSPANSDRWNSKLDNHAECCTPRPFEGHPHFAISRASIEVMQLDPLPGTEGT